jgi:hypothetical protein
MLVSDLKLLLRFQTSSLYEEASGTTMNVVGDTLPQILPGGGYIMSDDQYLLGNGSNGGGYNTDISDAFTLGFWLYPVNPGMATDPSSGDAVSISMPVINLNEIGSGEFSVVEITENTTVDGENNLTVSIADGVDVYSATTGDYAPSTWHHFWIVYNGISLSIYVDGISNISNTSGVFPSSLSGSMLDLYINHSLNGYAYNVAKNYGYISDIFLMNIVNSSESNMQRVINDGVEYFVDDSYTNLNIEKSSIYFNDPDTIVVTSSIDDMSYVYLGRNDGKILRGSPLFWETRRSFSENGEADLLGLSIDDKGISWDITPSGFLELKNTNVRL